MEQATKTQPTIKLSLELPEKLIDDILAGAFEGGSNYWLANVEVVNNDYKGAEFASEVLTRGGELKLTLNDEGDLYSQDGDQHPKPQYTIRKSDVVRGLEKHLQFRLDKNVSWNPDRFDGSDYDCVLQYALFNEVIFG